MMCELVFENLEPAEAGRLRQGALVGRASEDALVGLLIDLPRDESILATPTSLCTGAVVGRAHAVTGAKVLVPEEAEEGLAAVLAPEEADEGRADAPRVGIRSSDVGRELWRDNEADGSRPTERA